MTQQYIVDKYIFNAATKKITFPSLPNLEIEGIQLIINLNTGTIIYQMTEVTKGGTVSGNVLTLTFDTTSMSNTDKLQIYYSPPVDGFFDRMVALLGQLVDYVRAPSYMTKVPAGDKIQVLIGADSTFPTIANITTVAGVTTVSSVTAVTTVGAVTNLTNLNTIDSRELIWSMWDTEFNTGIRNKII